MVYLDLVARIADETGVEEEDIRKVLKAFPEILMECEEGEKTRTPLGVFSIVRRKQKAVRTPDNVWSTAPERIQAKLKPGKRLQRDVDANEPSTETEPD